jgi:hypothetical protein
MPSVPRTVLSFAWKALFCVLFPIFMVTVLGPCLVLGYLAKQLVRAFLWTSGLGKTYRLMSGADAMYCLPKFSRPETPQVATAMCVVKGRIDVEEVVRRGVALNNVTDLDERTMKTIDSMKWYPVRRFAYFLWRRDEDFEPANHIRRPTRCMQVYCL